MFTAQSLLAAFVAIVIEHYQIQRDLKASSIDFERLAKAWVLYDPSRTFFVPLTQLGSLLLRMPPPVVGVATLTRRGRRHVRALRPADLSAYLGRLRVRRRPAHPTRP